MPDSVVHFQIRMPPALYERLAGWAKDEKVSLNALIVKILGDTSEQRGGESPPAADGSGRK